MSSDVVAHSSTEDRYTVDDEAYEPTYAEAFPPLPVANTTERGEPATKAPAPQWKKLSLKTSTVTQVIWCHVFQKIWNVIGTRSNVNFPFKMCFPGYQVFCVPLEERKYKDLKEQSFGDQGWQGEQAKICGAIMSQTGTCAIKPK